MCCSASPVRDALKGRYTLEALLRACHGALWNLPRDLFPKTGPSPTYRASGQENHGTLSCYLHPYLSLQSYTPTFHQPPQLPEINVIIAMRACLRREWVHSPPIRQVPEETPSHCIRTGGRYARLCRWAATPDCFLCLSSPHCVHLCVTQRTSR